MHKKSKRGHKVMKILLAIAIVIILLLCIRFIYRSLHANHTEIDMNKITADNFTLECAVFDGNQVWEDSTIVIKDGVLTEESRLGSGESDSEYFLMPGLIDAHAHLTTPYQMEQMVRNGVTTVCDVSASAELQNSYAALNVWSSRSSAWMGVDDAEAFVKNTIAQGGKYIKVVADLPQIMGGGIMEQTVLEEIVRCAHENGLKVAVHAISVAGVQMAADAGTDLLIHIPIGETFPQELAEQIAGQGIAVMPTMAMMQAFADSPVYGYKKEDYQDAVAAVQLLHSMDVPILVATDSSDTFFVPQLGHGETLHKEMELLVEAGLPPLEVLKGATTEAAKAFEIDGTGTIELGMKAAMVLVKGRPDKEITDSSRIVQVWVDGKPVLESKEDFAYKESETEDIITEETGGTIVNNEELTFYPEHPSGTKTWEIETTAMPILEQEEPFEVQALYEEFCADLDGALEIYEDKRFEVTGIATKIGPDIHNKPSIEISDETGGQCYALCIFPSDDFYSEVSVGDKVTVRANYLVMSNWFGVVMKYSELVDVQVDG